MIHRRRFVQVGGVIAAALLAGTAGSAAAQATGELAGLVTGPDGAPLAGAIVTVTSADLESGEASLTTDAAGRYTLGQIPPGLYDVTVELQGYRKGSLATLKVEDGRTTQADLVLERRFGGEDGY
ncbi:MAG: carboxypeptidase regulatory-like domain-containing protein [Chloroflexi bacterium]|nr:carboxypeptidase regulatory-like domain-containing protein [Chloroflexota bacterium]